MAPYLKPQTQYDVKARRISGSRAEKLEQIDAAIQELLDIKLLESAANHPNVRFVAAPHRSRALAVTLTILVLLIALVLLIGVRKSHAQPVPAPWHLAGTFDVSFLNSTDDPENHLFRTRSTTPKVDEWGVDMAMVTAKQAPDAGSRWGVDYRRHFSNADAILRGEYRFGNSRGAQRGFFSGPDNALVPDQHLLIGAFILAVDHPFTVSK